MEREERVVDILMDDDEIGAIEEIQRERRDEEIRERDLTFAIPYRNVAIDLGSDIGLRILDIVIVIVAIILAYMIYLEVL